MLPVDPARVAADYRAAVALHRAGRLDEAERRYRALERVAPELAEIPYQLGRIALRRRAVTEARAHLERARTLKPEEPAILSSLAEALAADGAVDEALALHDRLIALAPKQVKPRADKALLLQRTGDFDAAEREFRAALKLAPKDGELYRVFLATKRLARGDPLIGAMQRAWTDPAVTGRARVHLGFALAKAMEDSGQPEKVFRYLQPANAGIRKAQPYDIAGRRAEVDGLIAAFRGGDFTPRGPEREGFAPIFVTGLPRSGTTLVEQILAAHPAVHGGGEMRHGLAAAYAVMGDPDRGFTPFRDLDDTALADIADRYAAAVTAQHGPLGRFTDKSIQSHLILGLLRAALPGAKLIVVRRDPRDLGLSIYKNVFADGTHRYAADLGDIAAYVATFERMVAFWQEEIPGAFHQIAYEDLIADPEGQTRALVAAAGLDWDPACLDFHTRTRQVQTLSVHQVRQPIYARSVGAWRQYEAELAPLIEGLHREGVLADGT